MSTGDQRRGGADAAMPPLAAEPPVGQLRHSLVAWAFAGSVLVSGASFLLLRRLPLAWTRGVVLVLAPCGGLAALGPIGLLMR